MIAVEGAPAVGAFPRADGVEFLDVHTGARIWSEHGRSESSEPKES